MEKKAEGEVLVGLFEWALKRYKSDRWWFRWRWKEIALHILREIKSVELDQKTKLRMRGIVDSSVTVSTDLHYEIIKIFFA
ncbi:hypothetical protein KKC32_03445 [Patescibacteria group bacterium]|nr:hypothetical protein [Patescibacteria group bacterium]